MPCVAGSRCKLSHLTPNLLGSTGHKCRKYGGQLHGICGVPDPLSNIDTKRIFDEECEPAAATKHTESKRSRAADTGKKDAAIDLTSTHGGSGRAGGNAGLIGASKTKAKTHGAEKRKHPTLGEKAEILALLIKKKMRQTAVAEKTGFALRTIQRVVADREKLEAKLKEQPPAANNKTFRGPKYPEVYDSGLMIWLHGFCLTA